MVDSQGDYASAETIEEACHLFNVSGGKTALQHDPSTIGTDQLTILESYICPADCEVGGQPVSKGTWLMTLKCGDLAWSSIKRGGITGLSLGGSAKRTAGAI